MTVDQDFTSVLETDDTIGRRQTPLVQSLSVGSCVTKLYAM